MSGPGTFYIADAVTMNIPGVLTINNVLHNETYLAPEMQAYQISNWTTPGFDHAGVAVNPPGAASHPNVAFAGPLQIFSTDPTNTVTFETLGSTYSHLTNIGDVTVINTDGFINVNNIRDYNSATGLSINSTTNYIYFNNNDLLQINELFTDTIGSVTGQLNITGTTIDINSVPIINGGNITLSAGATLYTNFIDAPSASAIDFNMADFNNVGSIASDTIVFSNNIVTPLLQSTGQLTLDSTGNIVFSSDSGTVNINSNNLTNVRSITVVGGADSTFSGTTTFNGITSFSGNVNILGGNLLTISKDTTFTADCSLSLANAQFVNYPKLIGMITFTGSTGAALGSYFSPNNPTLTGITSSRTSTGVYTVTLIGAALANTTNRIMASSSRSGTNITIVNAIISSGTTIDVNAFDINGVVIDPTEVNLCVYLN